MSTDTSQIFDQVFTEFHASYRKPQPAPAAAVEHSPEQKSQPATLPPPAVQTSSLHEEKLYTPDVDQRGNYNFVKWDDSPWYQRFWDWLADFELFGLDSSRLFFLFSLFISGFVLTAAVLHSTSEKADARSVQRAAVITAPSPQLVIKQIRDIRVGERVRGTNPVPEEAELLEPIPELWRTVSLEMKKESGLLLWMELLRPLEWVEQEQAEVGREIDLDLAEMGAVGKAKVTAISPCPEVPPPPGTIVTGTFRHQADESNQVLSVLLEDQSEPTGVTSNHPYWSVDRQEFLPIGEFRLGEHVQTEFGPKKILALTPREHDGFLYNLETTEHVFEVGSLGTLVHNSCAGNHHFVPKFMGSNLPYGHKSLTYLDKTNHTQMHNALNKFLEGKTKMVDGKLVSMRPGRGNSGRDIIYNFSNRERIGALKEFYGGYEGGKYLQNFLDELAVTNLP